MRPCTTGCSCVAPIRCTSLRSSRTGIDTKLVLGAVVFGIGWGLSGFCPGPAIVAMGSGATGALAFGAAMIAGMGLFHAVTRTLR
jgi:uncharacterized protein